MTRDKEISETMLRIDADLLTWSILLHALCVALRHPLNRGVSRPTQVAFARRLGVRLVAEGLLDDDEYAALLGLAGVGATEDIVRDEDPCPHCESTHCMIYDFETRSLTCGATGKVR